MLFNKYFEVLNRGWEDGFSIFSTKTQHHKVTNSLLRKQEKQVKLMAFLLKKLEKFPSVSNAKRYA